MRATTGRLPECPDSGRYNEKGQADVDVVQELEVQQPAE